MQYQAMQYQVMQSMDAGAEEERRHACSAQAAGSAASFGGRWREGVGAVNASLARSQEYR
jgi:hypothetical protein